MPLEKKESAISSDLYLFLRIFEYGKSLDKVDGYAIYQLQRLVILLTIS